MANKLDQLAEDFGYYSSYAMLKEMVFESVVPGICMREDCDYSTDVEPDCRDGWCECCEDNTIKSCMVLGGVI